MHFHSMSRYFFDVQTGHGRRRLFVPARLFVLAPFPVQDVAFAFFRTKYKKDLPCVNVVF